MHSRLMDEPNPVFHRSDNCQDVSSEVATAGETKEQKRSRVAILHGTVRDKNAHIDATHTRTISPLSFASSSPLSRRKACYTYCICGPRATRYQGTWLHEGSSRETGRVCVQQKTSLSVSRSLCWPLLVVWLAGWLFAANM